MTSELEHLGMLDRVNALLSIALEPGTHYMLSVFYMELAHCRTIIRHRKLKSRFGVDVKVGRRQSWKLHLPTSLIRVTKLHRTEIRSL